MKIFNLVSNIVIIVAFALMCIFHGKAKNEVKVAGEATGTDLAIAYVNIDSIIINYQKAIDLNEELMKQQESARTDVMAKARKLEEGMTEFQRKVDNNGFLSMERAQSEQQRLLAEKEKLEETQQRHSNELAMKQQDLNEQITESILSYIEEYNKEANYEVILTQNAVIGTVLYAQPKYNITEEVLTALNEQYKK